MISLLIVDDEMHAVAGIKSALNWDKLEIGDVYTAYNSRQAKEVFENNTVNILLCDIEMPQGNGMDLMAWVKEHYPQTVAIFLTCHAEFDLAKQAIHLGCMDYILKPVRYDELEAVVEKAVHEVKNSKEQEENNQNVERWFQNQPLLIENFWSDIMNQNIASVQELIKEAALSRNIPFDEHAKYFPILIIQQQWNIELTPVEKKRARQEFRSLIRSMVFRPEEEGEIIKLAHRRYLAILHLDEERSSIKNMGLEELAESCRRFVRKCREELYCDISCYIGESASAYELLGVVDQLSAMEENFSAVHNRVFLLGRSTHDFSHVKMPDMNLWSVMLAEGQDAKVMQQAAEFINSLQRETSLQKSVMLHFQQDYLQMIYAFLKQKSIHAHQLLSDQTDVELHESASRSVANLMNWVRHITGKAIAYVNTVEKSQSVVEKSKSFIAQSIDKDISREDVANHVFLNSDYLTRIFKKETGLSISEYIVKERFKIAMELLAKTDLPVSTVAAKVGYTNFSHFAKMFKRYTNVTPQEYRQKNMNEI